jgi:GDP-L-fucose synthase
MDVIIHLAANGGGIGYNLTHPGQLFYDNAIMGITLLEVARLHGVEKVVIIGTVCAYPKFAKVPFSEEELWDGYPEETNASYGLAKKMLLVQSQAYWEEYNFNSIYLLPVNLYGIGDDFSPKTSHVIPALIKKFVEAKQENKKYVDVWGTGGVTREFLYVDDAARAIVLATARYNKPQPVNIGSGMEITIKCLAEKIQELVGFEGYIKWDISKPEGQPKRRLEVSRAKKEFGFEAEIEFDEGLARTIEWYSNSKVRLYHHE